MGPRNGAELRIVPSSIQRVRCFLNTCGRMKVKPWASAQEVLEALRAALLAMRDDDGFWKDIKGLLAALCKDVAARASCSVPNEVLDPARLCALVSEIRNARPAGRGFRALCRALSAPAATLLIIMAGALVVGCEQGAILRGVPDASADVASEETADVTPDVPSDGWCPHEGIPIQEIVRECVADEDSRTAMLACLEALDASWHTGLKEALECMSCSEVSDKLYNCFLEGCEPPCTDPAAAGEFDLEAFLSNCCGPLYIGVRFE